VYVRHSWIPKIFFILCAVNSLLIGDVLLGVGVGIHSYPDALDPFDVWERVPVVYPHGEINFPVTDQFTIGCVFSHVVIPCKLDRFVDTPQKMDIYTGGLYGEVDLVSGPQCFGIGAQVQSVVSAHFIGPRGEYTNGFGARVYGIAQQRILSDISTNVRTGVQRVWVETSMIPVYSELQLDSYFVELVLYLHL